MLCVLNVLMRQRRDRAFVVGTFKRLCPDYQRFHRNAISDGAIWGRADTGMRAGYEREHPDKAPDIARYMPAAVVIVAAGVPMSAPDIRDLVKRMDDMPTPEPATDVPGEPVADPPPVVEFPEPAPSVAPEPAQPQVRRRPSIRRQTQRRDPALDDPNIVNRLRQHDYDALADEVEAGGEPDLPALPDDADEEEEVATEAPAMAAE
jgi:hypothetical protein